MPQHATAESSSRWISQDYEPGLFSVIVPTFNRATTLLEALDSVAGQSYRPIELVVIDDGSTDHTGQLLEEWLGADDRNLTVTCLYQANAGVCAARNHGLRHSRGEFIQFLDSDDRLHPDRLARLVETFHRTGCDYIETGFEGFRDDDPGYTETHYGHVGDDQFSLLLRGRLWPNTLRPAFTRTLIGRIGPWNESMKTFQDYEYAIRAFTLKPRPQVEAIREILASARRDGGDRMSNIFLTHEGRSLRIHCERLLCQGVVRTGEFDPEDVSQLASRIYGLAIRSNASGWPDLGLQCIELAQQLNIKLDRLGRRRRRVAHGGRLAAKLYGLLGSAKQALSR